MPGKSKDTAAAEEKPVKRATKAAASKVDQPADVSDNTNAPVDGDPHRDPELLQFPSAAGEPEVEIAARSQDVDEKRSEEHRKVFVVQKNPDGPDYDDDMHARNIDAMRQAMILQGLRPTEDGHFVGAEEHEDGQSVCLTYAAACVPAAVATPEQNVVAVTVEQQHALEEQTNG